MTRRPPRSTLFPYTTLFRSEAFRQGLRELGYVEGKNIVIDYRSAEGKPDRLPAVAAELVHLKVDLIVTRSEEHTSELQSQSNIVCRLLLEKKKNGFEKVFKN